MNKEKIQEKSKKDYNKSCKCDIPLIWSALAVTCLRCKGKV